MNDLQMREVIVELRQKAARPTVARGDTWEVAHTKRHIFGEIADVLERALGGKEAAPTAQEIDGDARLCEHANEVPLYCPCGGGCYCKGRSCRGAPPKRLPCPGLMPGSRCCNPRDADRSLCVPCAQEYSDDPEAYK